MNQLKEKNKNDKKGNRGVYKTTWEENTKRKINVKGEKPYSCSYCDKKFTLIQYLQYHVKDVLEKIKFENMFTCDTCPKIFKTKKGLSQHQKTHDKKSRTYCCFQEDCEKKFYNKTSYDNHMNIHNGIKPHKCSKC